MGLTDKNKQTNKLAKYLQTRILIPDTQTNLLFGVTATPLGSIEHSWLVSLSSYRV